MQRFSSAKGNIFRHPITPSGSIRSSTKTGLAGGVVLNLALEKHAGQYVSSKGVEWCIGDLSLVILVVSGTQYLFLVLLYPMQLFIDFFWEGEL